MEHPDKETLIKEMDLQIRNLKGTLTKAYPKRVIELKHIKRKVRDLEEYMQYLADHGIPEEQIGYMTKTIPYRLLGIDE